MNSWRTNTSRPDVYDKLSALLHQTYRITGVIDDLLLLSRMDAGRLQIDFDSVNLSQLLEEWIDDLSALPDDLHVKLETNFAPQSAHRRRTALRHPDRAESAGERAEI